VILQIIKSLIITFTVAAAIGYFLTTVGISFLPTFFLVVILQFLFFYFYGEIVKRRNETLQVEAEINIAKELSRQQVTVTCPCDRNIQTTIPVDLSRQNSYVCQGCNKDISVFIETKTALSTKPVMSNPLDTPIMLDEIQKVLKDDANRREK